jgi:hypothetical protein
MFYLADDPYRARYRVSRQNRQHPVFKVPYAYPAVGLEEATEVASHEQVYHKMVLDTTESCSRAATRRAGASSHT